MDIEKEVLYPNQYELQSAFCDFCLRRFVDAFAQERGIFIANATQEDLGEFLSGLFYDGFDLGQIHDAALHVYRRSSLSGFWAVTDGIGMSLIDELDAASGQIVDLKTSMTLGPIIEKRILGEGIFGSNVGYTQRQPGRIEFLNEVERNFEFYIKKMQENRWEILVDGHRSQDAQILENWFTNFSRRNYQVSTIDQGDLTSTQTVIFFDELARCGMNEEWRFTQVKKITLKRGSQKDEEDNSINADKSDLSGISQAILEGQDLRQNSFVKQCESGGYRFTAMTYEYENIRQPYIVEIRAEFKGRPKLFEVALENSSVTKGPEGKLEDYQFPKEQVLQMLSAFYGQAKIVFDQIIT